MKHPLLLAGLLTAALTSVQAQQLRLSETVRADITQDEMTVRFFTEAKGAQLNQLNQEVTKTLNRAFALKSKDVPVTAKGIYTQPVYDRNGRTGHYIVRASVEVKGTKLEQVSQITTQLSTFMAFESIQFSVSEATQRQTREALSVQAAQRFQDKAQKMATALNFARFEIEELTLDADQSHHPVMPFKQASRAMAMSSDAAPAMDFSEHGGTQTLSVTLSGVVALKR